MSYNGQSRSSALELYAADVAMHVVQRFSLYFSMDAGQTWTPIKVPGVHEIYRIAVAPTAQTELYLWTERGLIVADLTV